MKDSGIDDVPTDWGKVGPLKDCWHGSFPAYEEIKPSHKGWACVKAKWMFGGCFTKVWSSLKWKGVDFKACTRDFNLKLIHRVLCPVII